MGLIIVAVGSSNSLISKQYEAKANATRSSAQLQVRGRTDTHDGILILNSPYPPLQGPLLWTGAF